MRTLLTALPRRVWLPVLVALAVAAVALGVLLTGRAAATSPSPAAAPGGPSSPASDATAAGDHLGLVVVINRS